MKKALYILSAAAMVFASCDPICEDKELSFVAVDANTINQSDFITFTQADKDGKPAADGNFFTYSTNPSTIVEIYYVKADGSEQILTKQPGAAGTFELSPARGSSSEQTVYIRHQNATDLSWAVGSRKVNVAVATELPLQMKYLVADAGQKVWKWNVNGKTIWGNMGYHAGSGSAIEFNHEGQWWGVDLVTNDFSDQQQHRGDDIVTGDDDPKAYMIWKEDGSITSYNASGDQIRTGSFEMKEFNNSDASAFKMGDIKISAGAILWPYAINQGGLQPDVFEVCYLDAGTMCLAYAVPGTGDWSESTYWHFTSTSDGEGIIGSYTDQPSVWTWNTSEGKTVWGNMGYYGGDGTLAETSHEGQWWGVDLVTNSFADQQQHRGGDAVTGDDEEGAYMEFYKDGTVKCFDPSGSEIRKGTFKFEAVEPMGSNAWKVGDLKTSKGAILWPYAINMDGLQPESFEVVYLDGEKMCLFYDNGNAAGSWSESTYWHFMRKR